MTDNQVAITEIRMQLPPAFRTSASVRDVCGDPLVKELEQFGRDQHDKPIYDYPRVQFKVLDDVALLLGIAEGSALLEHLWAEGYHAEESENLPIAAAEIQTRREALHPTDQPVEYQFLTPWLALNQKNFGAYTGSRNTRFRKEELSRILTGNCLGMCKSLGMYFEQWISAEGSGLTSIKVATWGKGMIGFVGRFRVNLQIPDLLGLGKSVAHGFGTLSQSGAPLGW